MIEPVLDNFPKGVPKNKPVGKSIEGIEVWNRDWPTVRSRLFPEDINSVPRWSLTERHKHSQYWGKKFQYWHFPPGEKYDPDSEKNHEIVEFDKPRFGLSEIFRNGYRVFEPGCGGGEAAVGLAKDHKDITIDAIDYELGRAVPFPAHHPVNVKLQQMDWRHLDFPDNSFDSIFSDQGIALYGANPEIVKELTRVAKQGALIRASARRGIMGKSNFYELLAEQGWDVYLLRMPGGGNSELTVAKLADKQ